MIKYSEWYTYILDMKYARMRPYNKFVFLILFFFNLKQTFLLL